MGFSWQEYWSGLPCSPPGDLPGPGIEPMSVTSSAGYFTTSVTWEAQVEYWARYKYWVRYNISLIL